ncbi:MAG: hypothetical protein ACFFAZ_09895 [Promethearchaeota archaeon]
MAEERGASFHDIGDALRAAGQQIITEGEFLEQTLSTISRELVPRQQVLEWLK